MLDAAEDTARDTGPDRTLAATEPDTGGSEEIAADAEQDVEN